MNNSQMSGIRNRNYHGYKQLAKESGRRITDFEVLSGPADPFFAERPASRKWAEWFTALYEKRNWGDRVHSIRGLHYAMRTMPEPMPDGSLYDFQKPNHVQELYDAVKYARILGLVDDAMIVEEQNEPYVYVPEKRSFDLHISDPSYFGDMEIPDMPRAPYFFLDGYDPDQRYLIELWAEKNTMNRFLIPLARRYGVVLQTGRGQASLSMVRRLIERIKRYEKPAIILYINDFDQTGMTMPVAVARHIEHYLYTRHLDMNITLEQIIMTPELVEQYNLPVEPLGDDKNKDRSFKERYGVTGTTELDALEEIIPGEFSRVVEQNILRYYDAKLQYQVSLAKAKLEKYLRERAGWIWQAQKSAREFIREEHDGIAEDVKERLETYGRHLEFQQELEKNLLEDYKPDLDDFPIPEGKEVSSDGVLYHSLRDEEEQLAAYKNFQGKETHTVSWAGVGKMGEIGKVTTGNHNSKLTQEQKVEIQKLYATGNYNHTQLAEMYGVSQPTIYRVVAAIGK